MSAERRGNLYIRGWVSGRTGPGGAHRGALSTNRLHICTPCAPKISSTMTPSGARIALGHRAQPWAAQMKPPGAFERLKTDEFASRMAKSSFGARAISVLKHSPPPISVLCSARNATGAGEREAGGAKRSLLAEKGMLWRCDGRSGQGFTRRLGVFVDTGVAQSVANTVDMAGPVGGPVLARSSTSVEDRGRECVCPPHWLSFGYAAARQRQSKAKVKG